MIDSEGVRDTAAGPSIALHIIAANTPLLAWSSVARALLVESASIVRTPSDAPEVLAWTELFVQALGSVDAEIAGLVSIETWPSTNESITTAFCDAADAVLVYGSDATVARVETLVAADKSFVGYGHRSSFGLVLTGADFESAAAGSAADIAIFDQQGCLSPQILFVEGSNADIARFGSILVEELRKIREVFPPRAMAQAAAIREAIDLSRMQAATSAIVDPELRFSVIRHARIPEAISHGHGIVNLIPVQTWRNGLELLSRLGLQHRLQGASISAPSCDMQRFVMSEVCEFGVWYVCEAGHLQTPPFNWRENGIAPLSCLICI
jgi:hypothetical protein